MGTTLEKLVVEISADAKGLQTEIKGAEALVRGFGDETAKTEAKSSSSLKKLIPSWQAVGAAVTAAAAALGAAGLKMISMAADADATTAKFNTIFSGMEGSTQAWVDNFVAATGRHKYATMDALSDIQAVATAMGVEKEAGVSMAEALLQRSTDVAAFFNANDPEVLEAIKSGLVGEMEPLKKYGVILSEANVQQELSNMLGVEGAKTATAAQKVQARTNIILAQTSAIQGQQAREAGSLQEQWKKLSNTLSTTFADAGMKAMNSMTGVVTKVNELLGRGGLATLESVLGGVADAVAWTAETVLDIVDAFDKWGRSGLYDTLREFGGSILDNLTDALGGAYSAVQDFVGRGGLERMGEALKIVIDGMASLNRTLNDLGVYKAMGEAVKFIVNGLLGFADLVAYTIIEFDKFRRAILTTVADVLDAIGTVVPGADKMAAGIRKSLEKVPTEAAAALAPFPGVVTTAVQTANTQATAAAQTTSKNVSAEFGKMYGLTNTSLQGFPGMVSGNINAAAGPASSAAKNVASGAVGSLNTGMTPMAPNTAAIMSRVSGTISSAGSGMYSAAASAGQQAVNGMASKIASLQAIANQARAAMLSVQSSFNSATYYSGNMPSSGHGGSSSSTGKTGITSQGSDGTGEKNVKIREVHATGGMAGYTGWHWMEAGEVAIPKQYDWNKAVVSPVIRAMQSQQAPARTVQAEATTKKVIVTINNKSSDVSTLNRVITKAAKVNATARAI